MNEILRDVLYAVLTAVLPVITYFIIGLLQKKAKSVVENMTTDNFKNTINETLDLIFTAVTKTSQTYVDSLKASGNFDEAAQRKAFEDTKSTVLSLLSEESKEIIKTLYVDIDKWLEVQIENAVYQTKKQEVE